MNTTKKPARFTDDDIHAFAPSEKVGIVGTVTPDGLPHLSLITTIQARDHDTLILGQFCEGRSKRYMQENPHVAFLIMTLDRTMWRGRALWTGLSTEGPEYERLNELPMFRYNTYFGINTVHYLDLVETTGAEPLPMGAVTRAVLLTRLARRGARSGNKGRILPELAEYIFNRMDGLAFASYIDAGGFPVIVPLVQCQAADSQRLAFSTGAYRGDIEDIPPGATVAVFGLTMEMEDVLVRGTYQGIRRRRGIPIGTVDIEWVYNSMPPAHGQVYPPVDLKPVTEF